MPLGVYIGGIPIQGTTSSLTNGQGQRSNASLPIRGVNQKANLILLISRNGRKQRRHHENTPVNYIQGMTNPDGVIWILAF